jgi:hypothetical protein
VPFIYRGAEEVSREKMTTEARGKKAGKMQKAESRKQKADRISRTAVRETRYNFVDDFFTKDW